MIREAPTAMSAPSHLALVDAQAAPNCDTADRRSLDLLERLRRGWRPDENLLADAGHAERWTVIRHEAAPIYQFAGFVSQLPARTSLIIATVLAIDPKDGWALLFGGRWMTLGKALPEMRPFDPIDVARYAAAWLRRQND
jgi:hypothetical protein